MPLSDAKNTNILVKNTENRLLATLAQKGRMLRDLLKRNARFMSALWGWSCWFRKEGEGGVRCIPTPSPRRCIREGGCHGGTAAGQAEMPRAGWSPAEEGGRALLDVL